MTDAAYALLKSTNEGRVRNADRPRVYWEQGCAPNKEGHLMDSQSSRDRANRASVGKYKI